MIKIALDAMGGDLGHTEIVKGAVMSANNNLQIILVGKKNILQKELSKYSKNLNIKVKNAQEIIYMNEEPLLSFNEKKNASIIVATNLVKDKICDAVISAGNTGAQMITSLFLLGRLKGIKKPAIATYYPTEKGVKIFLDAGSTPDCNKYNLYQFALMSNFFCKYYLNIKSPSIGLLNIGSEENKGSLMYKEAYFLLKNSKYINFYGNIEGRDISKGIVDIVLCDGFVGNIALKLMEGLTISFIKEINKNINKSFKYKIGGLFLKNVFLKIKKSLDYSEYGGAPLLGVKGLSIVCHGSSNSKTIKQAIFSAKNAIENNFQEKFINYFEGKNFGI